MKATAYLIATLVLSSALAGSAEGTGRLIPSLKSGRAEIQTTLDYLVHVPSNYDIDPAVDWPLVLFLHGAGERGNDLDLLKVHGPPRFAAEGQDLPYIMIAPQCPADQVWNPWALLGLLDHVEREYRVDESRVYVTGLSMGGYGTWGVGAAAPDRFAAIAPICGGAAMPFWTVSALRATPIWAFHGTEDRVVWPSETLDAVELVRVAGGNPKVTMYEGVGHDSWTQTYEDEAFWEWLLAQRRDD